MDFVFAAWAWLESSTNLISATGTIATAVATILLWLVTKRLYAATQRLAEASARPQIVAVIRPNKWSINHADIEITNTGNATAFDIIIEFDPPIDRTGTMANRPMPLQKISLLRPNDSISSSLTDINSILKSRYSVTISWKSSPNSCTKQVLNYILDMNDYNGWGNLGSVDPLTAIAKQIENIRNDWRNITSGSKKINVNSFTSEDRDREQKQLSDWLDQCAKFEKKDPEKDRDTDGS
jgi:hypothetical protein